ncbi:Putative membrane protein [Streptomyces hygroscopicus subsp. limoneus]|nr:Putative membrane protein [Streptomyces hygroscopicus subsp. limoneus]
MVRNRRRRPTGARRATLAAVALMLGGAGLVGANVYASATEGWGDGSGTDASGRVLSSGVATIDCPDVGGRLTAVPDAARPEVDRELAALDQQIAAAYQQVRQAGRGGGEDVGSAGETIMKPLEEKRSESIGRIADALGRAGERPRGLDDLAACTLRPGDSGQPTGTPDDDGRQGGTGQGQGGAGADRGGSAQGQSGSGQGQSDGGQAQNGAGQGGNGPVVSDYADITAVPPEAPAPPPQADASRGTFTSDCGVNAGGLFNSDNVIVAPGVSNGAHHFHDYIGNQGNNAFASDEDLAKAGTSCADQGDKSSYYWPVLRLQNGTRERDAGAPGGGTEGNAGQIVTPEQVTLTFVGNPRGKVTAMPRLLRIITGDAKAFVNGPGNANASWSCTGYENRQLKDKYPLCPPGSDVVRTFRFQSCWDGRNIDSANHRTHVAFTAADGSCPAGFEPIPQLVQRIVYDVDAPSLADGGRAVPLFAVDSFPEQLHKPVTDHGDFINVFGENLMREMVDCINSGRACGSSADDGSAATPTPTATSSATAAPGDGSSEESGGSEQSGGSATSPPAPSASRSGAAPRHDATTSPARTTKHGTDDKAAPAVSAAPRSTPARSAPAPSPAAPTQAAPAPVTAAAYAPPTAAGTEPQASRGGLAETGAHLWPAAIGTLLALSGLFMLLRARRMRY